MSALICSDLQTTVAALAYHIAVGRGVPVMTAAAGFREANIAALVACYGDSIDNDDRAPLVLPVDLAAQLERDARAWICAHSGPDLAAAVRCLRYQCAEGGVLTAHPWGIVLDRFACRLEDATRGADSDVWTI